MTILRFTTQWLSCRQASNRPATRAARVSVIVALIVSMAGTTVVMLAESASAAVPGLEYVTGKPSEFDSRILKHSQADCPPGKQVIGTGFRLDGAPGDIILDDMIPMGNGVRVQAGEDQDGTSAKWQVVAIAVCANPLPGYNVHSMPSDFGPAGIRTVVAECDPGTRLIGSGVQLTQGFGQIAISRLSIGSDFVEAEGTADQDGFSGSWQIVAFAFCANPLPGLKIVSASSQFNSDTPKFVRADCPAGKHALGVGWAVSESGQAIMTRADIFSAGADFSASEDDDGFSGSWEMDAGAICAPA